MVKLLSETRSLIEGGVEHSDEDGTLRPHPENPSVGSTLAPSSWYQDDDSATYPWRAVAGDSNGR